MHDGMRAYTKVKTAQVLKRVITKVVGEDAVRAAEQQVSGVAFAPFLYQWK